MPMWKFNLCDNDICNACKFYLPSNVRVALVSQVVCVGCLVCHQDGVKLSDFVCRCLALGRVLCVACLVPGDLG